MKKRITLFLGLMLSIIFMFSAYAGEWKTAENGRWWYQNDDGSYPQNTWQLINEKYYYFDAEGYLLVNTTTPDGYWVGEDGAMVSQGAGVQKTTNSVSSSASGFDGTYYWTPSGKSYHKSKDCRSLARSKTICSGSLSDAKREGKDDPCNNCVR